jgi:uncharacterized protein YjbI with pentapeptide repeats
MAAAMAGLAEYKASRPRRFLPPDDYLTLYRGLDRFSAMTGPNTWYVRRRGEVQGPYPAGLVSRYILLGRLKETDQVSTDREAWRTVSDVPELIPKILKGDTSDPLFQERLEAARRWADERDRNRRASRDTPAPGGEQRGGDDRRRPEEAALASHRLARSRREQERLAEVQNRWAMLFIAGTVAVMIGLSMAFYTPPPAASETDCRRPPAPRVIWSNCTLDGASLEGQNLSAATLYSTSLTGADLRHSVLRGANLSYARLSISDLRDADLRRATLLGANLRGARLHNALLDQADLSYADLTGADLSGASLANARLANAIWTDGKRCLPGSMGSCRTAK